MNRFFSFAFALLACLASGTAQTYQPAASTVTYGTTPGTAAQGNDARFPHTRDFLPSQISGLVLWLRGTDLGALAEGAAINASSLIDRSGLGNSPTAVSGVTKATSPDGRVVMRFGASSYLTLPTGLTLNRQAQSAFFVSNAPAGIALDAGTGGQDAYYLGGNTPYIYTGGLGGTHVNGRTAPLSQCLFLAHGFTASTTATTFRVNDYEQSVGALTAGTVSGGRIGNAVAGGFGFIGDLPEACLYNRALTIDERNALFAYLARPPIRSQVACLGDSITFGYSATSEGLTAQIAYPTQLNRILGDGVKVLNYGVSGQTLAQIQSAIATYTVLPDATTFPNGNIAIVYGGTNDIDGGATGTTTYASLVSICGSLRTAGFRVLVATMLSRSTFSATQEGYRQTFNTSVRAAWPMYADGMVDLDATTVMGGVGTYANTTYFTDGTHPTRLGYNILAHSFADGINRMAVPTAQNLALGTTINGAALPVILSTTAGINAFAVANTPLYTAPTGKTCVVTGYNVRVTAASGVTAGPSAGVGNAAGTNNIAASQAMTGLTATTTTGSTSEFSWPVVGMSAVTPAGGTIYFNLSTAATGTSETIAVDTIGYLY